MNKKIILGIIAIVLTVGILIVLALKKDNDLEFKNTKSNETVTFKILFGIQVKDERLLPKPIDIDKNLISESIFINEHKLFYITNFFEVENRKDFKKSKTIYLFPYDFVPLKRIPRDKVTSEFFVSRGVSENNAIKCVNILQQKSYTNTVCLKKMRRIFTGSDFNKQFFKKAISRLIYL